MWGMDSNEKEKTKKTKQNKFVIKEKQTFTRKRCAAWYRIAPLRPKPKTRAISHQYTFSSKNAAMMFINLTLIATPNSPTFPNKNRLP